MRLAGEGRHDAAIEQPSDGAADQRDQRAGGDHRHPGRLAQREADIAAEGEHGPVGEVQHAAGPVDNDEPESHQAVDGNEIGACTERRAQVEHGVQ